MRGEIKIKKKRAKMPTEKYEPSSSDPLEEKMLL